MVVVILSFTFRLPRGTKVSCPFVRMFSSLGQFLTRRFVKKSVHSHKMQVMIEIILTRSLFATTVTSVSLNNARFVRF